MANYVKFLRGTPAAWAALPIEQRNSDTLYFIFNEESNEADLYLGNRLISGGSAVDDGKSTLAALSDVFLSTVADKQLLVYDASSSKWVNKSATDVVSVFIGASADAAGRTGLVPAPDLGVTNHFLRSDGHWVDIAEVIITVENTEKLEHSALLAAQTGFTPKNGDIVIIKDAISEGKWQHTAYVHNGTAWAAMDGNYNAENVFFDKDLMTTTAIGNISLENGQATISAAGKNLKQVFETIFVQEDEPDVTQPSVSITASKNKAYEVGTKVTPTYEGSYSAGSYQYGPNTGVTASEWKATDSNKVEKTGQSGSFDELTVTDTISYTIKVQATMSDGAMPKTNIGNDYADGQIKSSVKTATSGAITGYRNTFYGTLTEKDTLTSDIIRGLTKSNAAYTNGKTFKITIPVGCLRVVFAYPATLRDVTSVLDKNDSNANIVTGFTKSTLDVEGANDYEAISYKVYTMDFANPYDAANEFSVTI